MITYILPCAGLGTRLGLPYPKEIHRIQPGVSLIDFSLAHITEDIPSTEKVVIVLTPGKEKVATYAESKLSNMTKVERVYFNDRYSEWPGSIHSAETHFGEYNVALLPDSILTTKPHETLATQYSAAFDEGADLVFACVNEASRQRLSSLGALYVKDSRVVHFCDKPLESEPTQFNAFWASFGFRREVGPKVLDFMMKSVAREKVNLDTLGLNVSAFAVDNYVDLGTWPSIASHLDARNLVE
ncbi:MAG: hypothetical protein ABJE63_11815 [Lentilitoribacter sp.]